MSYEYGKGFGQRQNMIYHSQQSFRVKGHMFVLFSCWDDLDSNFIKEDQFLAYLQIHSTLACLRTSNVISHFENLVLDFYDHPLFIVNHNLLSFFKLIHILDSDSIFDATVATVPTSLNILTLSTLYLKVILVCYSFPLTLRTLFSDIHFHHNSHSTSNRTAHGNHCNIIWSILNFVMYSMRRRKLYDIIFKNYLMVSFYWIVMKVRSRHLWSHWMIVWQIIHLAVCQRLRAYFASSTWYTRILRMWLQVLKSIQLRCT